MIGPEHFEDLRQQVASAPAEFYRHCHAQDIEVSRIRTYLAEMDRFASVVRKHVATAPGRRSQRLRRRRGAGGAGDYGGDNGDDGDDDGDGDFDDGGGRGYPSISRRLVDAVRPKLADFVDRAFPMESSVLRPSRRLDRGEGGRPGGAGATPSSSHSSSRDNGPRNISSRSTDANADTHTVAADTIAIDQVGSKRNPVPSEQIEGGGGRRSGANDNNGEDDDDDSDDDDNDGEAAAPSPAAAHAAGVVDGTETLVKDVVRARAIVGAAQFIKQRFKSRAATAAQRQRQ